MFFLAGCGGVSHNEVRAPAPAIAQNSSAPKAFVRIAVVKNSTGRPEIGQLCHYVHLKTTEVLEQGGRFAVLSDELLQEANLPFVKRNDTAAANWELNVEILRAEESAGATVSLAVFSSQQQKATVQVKVRWRDLANGVERTATGKGLNSKGAWGVVAKVNRESLLKGKGYWDFDQSMLGGAAAAAMQEALGNFP